VGEWHGSGVKAEELAAGGMVTVRVEGRDLVLCNAGGRIHAVQRRCGHMSAPLEQGTLDGTVLTCPMHCAQFDVTTGEALAGPIPHDWGTEPAPPRIAQALGNVGALMTHILTEPLRTYDTKVEAGVIWVAL
jgi:nitrite reductase/ring-hydroxylating ferredoxin subunit